MAKQNSTPIPSKGTVSKNCVGAITVRVLMRIRPAATRFIIRDTKHRKIGEGLTLRVEPSGSRIWYWDYRTGGKRFAYRIGPVKPYKVANHSKAELDKAEEALQEDMAAIFTQLQGTDPVALEKARREAERAAQAKQQLEQSRTLRSFLEKKYYPNYLKARASGEATKKRILAAWEPLLGEKLENLTNGMVDEVRARRRDKGVSPQTINRDYTALLAMLNKAIEWDMLASNPLTLKRLDTDDDKRVRYLGERDQVEDIRGKHNRRIGERERFMAALEHKDTPDYLRVMVHLALNTGLRRSEIFKLRWENVDFARKQLTVRARTTKTRKNRHIPINATLLGILEDWRKTTNSKPVVNLSGAKLVFPGKDGKPFRDVKRSWASLIKRAIVTDFHLHDCRHDFASRMVMAGIDLYVVKGLLGHSTIQMTERYSHLAPNHLSDAVEVLK